jgi:hypothetical protein
LPTFDPLAVLWQFYFAPPEQDEAEFNVATTRRVYHSRFHRTGVESVKLSFGEVDAEVWERTAGDGNISARVWLAPSLHYVMVKRGCPMARLTGEALLDSIRVDGLSRSNEHSRARARACRRAARGAPLTEPADAALRDFFRAHRSSGSTSARSSPTACSPCCDGAAR